MPGDAGSQKVCQQKPAEQMLGELVTAGLGPEHVDKLCELCERVREAEQDRDPPPAGPPLRVVELPYQPGDAARYMCRHSCRHCFTSCSSALNIGCRDVCMRLYVHTSDRDAGGGRWGGDGTLRQHGGRRRGRAICARGTVAAAHSAAPVVRGELGSCPLLPHSTQRMISGSVAGMRSQNSLIWQHSSYNTWLLVPARSMHDGAQPLLHPAGGSGPLRRLPGGGAALAAPGAQHRAGPGTTCQVSGPEDVSVTKLWTL